MPASRVATGRGARPQVEWDERTEGLLQDWHNRAAAAQIVHYQLAHRLKRRNLMLGIPAVVFSTVVGTSLFATLTRAEVNRTLRVAIGAISVLAAVLAALQTLLRFAERGEKHVTAADWFAAIRRDTAQLIALPPAARGPVKPTLDDVRKELSKASQQSPEMDEALWQTVCARFNVDSSK